MAYLDQMNVKANESDTVGTDYDLRDKDLNAAAATTSVGSTQNIVLKGTDGSYHTIDKSSFTEAVRGVLGGILNNMTSKGTAVKGVGVIDNSNDFGLTTPSDLASVLGVGNLRKDIPGTGSQVWYRIAHVNNNATISGIIGYTPYENVGPSILCFSFYSYELVHGEAFVSLNGGKPDNFKFKSDSTGATLWMAAVGTDTHNFVIPTSKGYFASFDVIQENPPSDAVDVTWT